MKQQALTLSVLVGICAFALANGAQTCNSDDSECVKGPCHKASFCIDKEVLYSNPGIFPFYTSSFSSSRNGKWAGRADFIFFSIENFIPKSTNFYEGGSAVHRAIRKNSQHLSAKHANPLHQGFKKITAVHNLRCNHQLGYFVLVNL